MIPTPQRPSVGRNRTPWTRTAAALAAAAGLLLAAAACGGTPEPTPTPPPTPEPPAQTSPTATPRAASTPTGPTATPTVTPTPDPADRVPPTIAAPSLSGRRGGEVGDSAPEFAKDSNWLNSEPLTIAGLRGQVVLIDFWTYTCINCIRTMPFLREWQEKYAEAGLVIVGVHSPEFEFEKVTANVEQAIAEFMLGYPVVQDNDFLTWRSYDNRFWPAKYLIDAEGVVRYTHFGEGAYDQTELKIRGLLAEAGRDVSAIPVNHDRGPVADLRAYSGGQETRITREIYGGWQRNSNPRGRYIAHPGYYEGPFLSQLYTDPGDHANGFLYLQGEWTADVDAITHARTTRNYEDYLALRFSARSVNVVIDFAEGTEPFEVQVTLDGGPLNAEDAGRDVVIEGTRSYFIVDGPRLYEVVSLLEYGDGELTFSSNSKDFGLFALTFGAYADIP
ncbi:MAG: redoxin domain-containing protein [Chloroflexi bacterium]|nr:redoxin domain-containing protein [Chloroflexota bacterium]